MIQINLKAYNIESKPVFVLFGLRPYESLWFPFRKVYPFVLSMRILSDDESPAFEILLGKYATDVC
jgi:hypothetical protein